VDRNRFAAHPDPNFLSCAGFITMSILNDIGSNKPPETAF
jgi:hypothetical protein